MSGQRIDWRRAKHLRFVESPVVEISHKEATEDYEILRSIAKKEHKLRKEAFRKLPRSLKERKRLAKLEKARSRPDRPEERRLLAILSSPLLRSLQFDKEPLFPLSDRAFICDERRIRIIILPGAQGRSITIRPGQRDSFDWVLIKLTSESVMNDGSFVAARISEICQEQANLSG